MTSFEVNGHEKSSRMLCALCFHVCGDSVFIYTSLLDKPSLSLAMLLVAIF